jgi:hypothetical protein
MKTLASLAIALCLGMLIGCGHSPKQVHLDEISKSGIDVPMWFAARPSSKDNLYGVGMSTSKLLQVALDRAKMNATTDVANQLQTRIEALKKDFLESTGLGKEEEILTQFTNVQKQITAETLSGATVDSTYNTKDADGIISFYVLMKYPFGAGAKAFLDGMSKQKRLYTEFKASKAFEDLQAEIKAYEEKQGN